MWKTEVQAPLRVSHQKYPNMSEKQRGMFSLLRTRTVEARRRQEQEIVSSLRPTLSHLQHLLLPLLEGRSWNQRTPSFSHGQEIPNYIFLLRIFLLSCFAIDLGQLPFFSNACQEHHNAIAWLTGRMIYKQEEHHPRSETETSKRQDSTLEH